MPSNVAKIEFSVLFINDSADAFWHVDTFSVFDGNTNVSSGSITGVWRDANTATVAGYNAVESLLSGNVREHHSGNSENALLFTWTPTAPVAVDRIVFATASVDTQTIIITPTVHLVDGTVRVYRGVRYGGVYADRFYSVSAALAALVVASDTTLLLDGAYLDITQQETDYLIGVLGNDYTGYGAACVELLDSTGLPVAGVVSIYGKQVGASGCFTRSLEVSEGQIAHFAYIPKGTYSVVGVPTNASVGAPIAFDIIV